MMTDAEKVKVLEKALSDLLDQIDVVIDSPEYHAVFMTWFTHYGQYDGPQFKEEYDAARKVLAEVRRT